MSVVVPPPVGAGRDTPARRAARAALARVLWGPTGARRLPTERALVEALEACDPRDVWWVCEASSAGPVYLLPTREWVEALARLLDRWRVRRVLEVAAGDGFLSRCLSEARPRLQVIATDDQSWRLPSGRMSSADRRRYAAVPMQGIAFGDDVKRMAATTAVKTFAPDMVLVSWAPPGTLVERVIRSPCTRVLDISVDGDVCGNGARTWRFHKELLEGPVEGRALCRLDARPRQQRHTRVTLYYGRSHPDYGVDPSAAALWASR